MNLWRRQRSQCSSGHAVTAMHMTQGSRCIACERAKAQGHPEPGSRVRHNGEWRRVAHYEYDADNLVAVLTWQEGSEHFCEAVRTPIKGE